MCLECGNVPSRSSKGRMLCRQRHFSATCWRPGCPVPGMLGAQPLTTSALRRPHRPHRHLLSLPPDGEEGQKGSPGATLKLGVPTQLCPFPASGTGGSLLLRF